MPAIPSLIEYYKTLKGRMHKRKVGAFIKSRQKKIEATNFIFVKSGYAQPEWSRKNALRIYMTAAVEIVQLRRYRAKKLREYVRFQKRLDALIEAEKDDVGSGAAPTDDYTEKERAEMEAIITNIIAHNEELLDEMLGDEDPLTFDAFIIKEDGTCHPPLNADMIGQLLDRFDKINHKDTDAAWRHANSYCDLFLAHDRDDKTPFLFRQDDHLQARFRTQMKTFMEHMDVTHDHDAHDDHKDAIHAQLHAIVDHWQAFANRPEHQMSADSIYATNANRWQRLATRLPRPDPQSSMSMGRR